MARPRITKEQKTLARFIRAAWLLRRNTQCFGLFLEEIGFRLLPISIKNVAVGKTLVVKWDSTRPDPETGNAADYEARQYRRARPRKKRWLTRTILDSPGLLIQERLPIICSRHCGQCGKAKRIAQRLRIADWHNHGLRGDGSLVFFDTDSCGT